MRKMILCSMFLSFLMVFCGETTIKTPGPYNLDGDFEKDLSLESESDFDQELDNEVHDSESTENESLVEYDSDLSENDQTEDDEDVEEVIRWCERGPVITPTKCENLQGTCEYNQICIVSTGGHCYSWTKSGLCAPEDAPKAIDGGNPPKGYSSVVAYCQDSLSRCYLKTCTNPRHQCKYPADGECCEKYTGFWYPDGYELKSDSFYKIICNSEHVATEIYESGCYFDTNNDGKIDSVAENRDLNPDNPCLYCDQEKNRTEWTPVPEGGEECHYELNGKQRLGICDGKGNCVPKY